MSKRYKAKRRARRNAWLRRCQHEGCTVMDAIPCFLNSWDKEPEEYFCGEHAWRHGYCSCCGQFWGGIESFEFRRSGLCDQCHDQVMADMGEFVEDDLEPD